MTIQNYTDFRECLDGVANRFTWKICSQKDFDSNNFSSRLSRYLQRFSRPLVCVPTTRLSAWAHYTNPIHLQYGRLDEESQQIYAFVYLAHHYGGVFSGLHGLEQPADTYCSLLEENVNLALLHTDCVLTLEDVKSCLSSIAGIAAVTWAIRRRTYFTEFMLNEITSLLGEGGDDMGDGRMRNRLLWVISSAVVKFSNKIIVVTE